MLTVNNEVDVKQSTRSSSGNTPIAPPMVDGGTIRLLAGVMISQQH
jgi:hypothetical protein